jgi:hypothetical protein
LKAEYSRVEARERQHRMVWSEKPDGRQDFKVCRVVLADEARLWPAGVAAMLTRP